MTTPITHTPMVKWSYLDHWRSPGPAGPIDQWQSRLAMTRFLRQIAAVGFDAIDTFDLRFWQILEQYGSVANYQEFVQEQGLERMGNTFHGVYYTPARYAPEVPATHETILEDFKVTMDRWSGTPHAERFVRTEGGPRRIERWFFEPTDEGGLIDFEAFARAVAESGYSGWIVVESDQSPRPAESAMVSGWYVQKVLRPIVEGSRSAHAFR